MDSTQFKDSLTKTGYDPKLFIEEVNDDWLCPLCASVYRLPTELPCAHVLCQSCVKSLTDSLCPECRTPFKENQLQIGRQLQKKIQGGDIKCPNGCDKKGLMIGVDEQTICTHLDQKCSLRLVMCHYGGCKKLFSPESLELHEKNECLYRWKECEKCHDMVQYYNWKSHEDPPMTKCINTVVCPYIDDMKSPDIHFLRVNEMSSHIENCGYKTINCKWCSFKCYKKNMSNHESENTKEHFSAVLRRLEQVEHKIEILSATREPDSKRFKFSSSVEQKYKKGQLISIKKNETWYPCKILDHRMNEIQVGYDHGDHPPWVSNVEWIKISPLQYEICTHQHGDEIEFKYNNKWMKGNIFSVNRLNGDLFITVVQEGETFEVLSGDIRDIQIRNEEKNEDGDFIYQYNPELQLGDMIEVQFKNVIGDPWYKAEVMRSVYSNAIRVRFLDESCPVESNPYNIFTQCYVDHTFRKRVLKEQKNEELESQFRSGEYIQYKLSGEWYDAKVIEVVDIGIRVTWIGISKPRLTDPCMIYEPDSSFLRKKKWHDYQIGDRIFIKHSDNQWYACTVTESNIGNIFISHTGFKAPPDVKENPRWIRLDTHRGKLQKDPVPWFIGRKVKVNIDGESNFGEIEEEMHEAKLGYLPGTLKIKCSQGSDHQRRMCTFIPSWLIKERITLCD